MAIQSRSVSAEYLAGEKTKITLEDFPSECPICHKSGIPKYHCTVFLEYENEVQTAYQCTNEKCQQLFVATFEKEVNTGHFYCKKVQPIHPLEAEFSQEISEISPGFVEIYNQALAAEALNLDQIVGIALRKAIEFLVKDYAINKNPADTEEIKGIFLGKCIEKYIDDPTVKACFKRATWLGNDETHYMRRWENKDIEDLKTLIKISINGLESQLLADKYLEEMPE